MKLNALTDELAVLLVSYQRKGSTTLRDLAAAGELEKLIRSDLKAAASEDGIGHLVPWAPGDCACGDHDQN